MKEIVKEMVNETVQETVKESVKETALIMNAAQLFLGHSTQLRLF